jgi:hypothetical protein
MYTLRTIETDGREVNLYLGSHYTIHKKGSVSGEEFKHKIDQFFGESCSENEHPEQVKSFIDAENLPNSLPLYWDKNHYIVNESGKTFQKL